MNRAILRRVSFLFLIALFTFPLSAQDEAERFTLKDAVLKRFSDYYPERMKQLDWLPKGHVYSFVEEREEQDQLIVVDAEKDAEELTLSLKKINEDFKQAEVEFSFFPRVRWIDNKTLFLNSGQKYFTYHVEESEVELKFEVPENAEELKFNNNYTACSFIMDHNLYYQKDNGVRIQVTADGKEGIVYGKAVHRSEFGITTGMFWAPDHKKLAFYRMDETMVDQYPLVDISSQPAALNNIRYPMAGTKSHHVTLGVFDPDKVKSVYMKTGEPKDQYLTSVTWSPNSKDLYIALLNRDQNQLKLNRYSAQTGAFDKTILKEADEAYVEPEHPLWFIPHDEDQFIWQSERDGFNHLYLYDTDGDMQRQLTTGRWVVEDILGFDDTKNYLFVKGTGEVIIKRDSRDESKNAMHRFTYMVDFALEGKEILDEVSGTHMGSISADGKYLIEHLSSIDIPWKTTIYRSIGKELKIIHQAEDPTEPLGISKPELIEVGSAEYSLYGRVIKPSDFDPSKKYPLLLYVYGGPHAQLVRDAFLGAAPLWMYWLAEQGYIVATIDNRGSDSRGLAFEQTTFRNLGTVELVDQKTFVDYLVNEGYVDQERMAIHGWSYGGFMTINMMLSYPGMFKAGAAGGPVCDWSMYEVMYTERYMDTPQANPQGFKQVNLVERADELEDDLLVIHGTVDDVVVWQHSQSFVKACVDNEVQLDYFIYPGHPHNVRGKDRYHLMENILNYVMERTEE